MGLLDTFKKTCKGGLSVLTTALSKINDHGYAISNMKHQVLFHCSIQVTQMESTIKFEWLFLSARLLTVNHQSLNAFQVRAMKSK